MPEQATPIAASSETAVQSLAQPAALGPGLPGARELPSAGPPPDLGDGLGGGVVPTALRDSQGWLDAIQSIPSTLSDAFGHGGPVLLVLGVLSIAALAIVLVKLWQFAQLRLAAAEPVERALRLWYQDQTDAALEALAGSEQPTAKLVERAVSALRRPGVPIDILREELVRFAGAQLEQLRAWLRALEVIAALSPLLGLLGTVLGMIEAFRQLQLAGSQVDPAILSGGIWQALLTTAAGLCVAIPVVLMHAWLERRVERCGHRMEDAVTRVFTRVLQEPPGRADALASDGAAAPMPGLSADAARGLGDAA